MAINPFTIRDLQLPAPVKTQALDFSGLKDIGADIGRYRRQQDIGSILAGAIDASGNLDPMRAASELGKRGYVKEADDFIQSTIRQQAVKQSGVQHAETQKRLGEAAVEAARHNVATEAGAAEARKRAQEAFELQKKVYEEGKIREVIESDPFGTERKFLVYPDNRPRRQIGGPPEYVPPAAAPPAATPGPRSEAPVPGAPGSVAELPARPGSVGDRFAGMQQLAALSGMPTSDTTPAVPPGTRVAQAGTAPAPVQTDRETALQQVRQQYGPEAADTLKAIVEYKQGVPKGKTEQGLINLARKVDPNFDPSRFEAIKSRQPPTGYRWKDPSDPDKGVAALKDGPAEKVEAEVAARIGQARKFLDDLGTQYDAQGNARPGLRERISKGELNRGILNPLQATTGYGVGPTEVRNKIDSGADALLRNLTGAGMNKEEAENYARRYSFRGLRDVPQTAAGQLSKLDELERELQYIVNEVGKGRGREAIEILRKEGNAPPPSQWTKGDVPPGPGSGRATAPAATAPRKVTDQEGANGLVGQAKEALQQRPDQYDEIAKRLRDRGVPNPERLLGPRPK